MYSHLLVASVLPLLAAAHGYLSSPAPRGIEKEAYQVDALKSPNTRGLCRGEPVGKIHRVRAGSKLTLGFTITAPHTGPCVVTILDERLGNERPVAEKYDCAAPGKVAPWTITLPSNARGRQVLRWFWQGRHVSPGEDYEQCIDLDFGGGDDAPEPTYEGDLPVHVSQHTSAPTTPAPEAPRPQQYDDNTANEERPQQYDNNAANEERPRQYGKPATQQQRPKPKGYGRSRGHNQGGACTDGGYRCTGAGFQQCVNGKWSAHMRCAEGTKCRADGSAISCVYA